MNKTLLFGALGTIALGASVYATGVFAATETTRNFGPNHTAERHEQMEKAFETNDYAAWKNLMGNRRAAQVITAETFPKFARMHELREDGKTDEANALRTELGLGAGNGSRHTANHRGTGARNGFVDSNNDGVCDRQQ
jgi:hypothetical protein